MSKTIYYIVRSLVFLCVLGIPLYASSLQNQGIDYGGADDSLKQRVVSPRIILTDPSFLRIELLLDLEGARCLVQEEESSSCVLDVEAFNRRVLTRQMFEGRNVDFIRARILQEALETVFWTRKGQTAGMEAPASVEMDLRNYLRFFSQSESRRVSSRKEFPAHLLRRLYERHYRSSFVAAKDLSIRFIGSSDRSFLEKVRMDIDAARRPGKIKSDRQTGRLRWIQAMASNLPEDLAAALDTLTPGKDTLVSTAFGHFLLHVDSLEILPEVTFEEAEGTLRELAVREDPDIEYRAHIYWQNNRREFLSPDTILLAAWLNPADVIPLVGGKDLAAVLAKKLHQIIPNTSLPMSVRSSLPESLLTIGSIFGPVVTPLGEWFFQPLSRKPGGRLKSFREVSESLKERMIYPPVELYHSLEKDMRIVKNQNILAMAMQQNFIDAFRTDSTGGDSPRYAEIVAEKESWLRSLKVEGFPRWPLDNDSDGENLHPRTLNAPTNPNRP